MREIVAPFCQPNSYTTEVVTEFRARSAAPAKHRIAAANAGGSFGGTFNPNPPAANAFASSLDSSATVTTGFPAASAVSNLLGKKKDPVPACCVITVQSASANIWR